MFQYISKEIHQYQYYIIIVLLPNHIKKKFSQQTMLIDIDIKNTNRVTK